MFCKTGNPVGCVCSAGHSPLSPGEQGIPACAGSCTNSTSYISLLPQLWLHLLFLRGKNHHPAVFLQGAIEPTRKYAPDKVLSGRTSRARQQMLLAMCPAPAGDSLSLANAEVPWPPHGAVEGTSAAAACGGDQHCHRSGRVFCPCPTPRKASTGPRRLLPHAGDMGLNPTGLGWRAVAAHMDGALGIDQDVLQMLIYMRKAWKLF